MPDEGPIQSDVYSPSLSTLGVVIAAGALIALIDGQYIQFGYGVALGGLLSFLFARRRYDAVDESTSHNERSVDAVRLPVRAYSGLTKVAHLVIHVVLIIGFVHFVQLGAERFSEQHPEFGEVGLLFLPFVLALLLIVHGKRTIKAFREGLEEGRGEVRADD